MYNSLASETLLVLVLLVLSRLVPKLASMSSWPVVGGRRSDGGDGGGEDGDGEDGDGGNGDKDGRAEVGRGAVEEEEERERWDEVELRVGRTIIEEELEEDEEEGKEEAGIVEDVIEDERGFRRLKGLTGEDGREDGREDEGREGDSIDEDNGEREENGVVTSDNDIVGEGSSAAAATARGRHKGRSVMASGHMAA